MSKQYTFTVQREVLTYAYLYKAAEDSLERTREKPEGSFYQIMSSLIFSAFALEAYLNHLGAAVIKYWDEIEQIKTLQKLTVLHIHLKVPFDASRRPVQTITQLFKFRNFMAHGRTESVTGSGTLDKPDVDPARNLVQTKWEEFCTEKEANRALEDVKRVIEILHEAADLGKYPLVTLDTGSHSISLNKA